MCHRILIALKAGKTEGLNGCARKTFKSCGEPVGEWLEILLGAHFLICVVPTKHISMIHTNVLISVFGVLWISFQVVTLFNLYVLLRPNGPRKPVRNQVYWMTEY